MFEMNFQIDSTTHYHSFLRQLVPAYLCVCLPKENKGCSKVSERIGNRCSHALIEAVNNAIFHAHKGKAAKPIKIKIVCNSEKIEMSVKDSGNGFHMKDVPEPKVYETHGRGLFLIKAIMDKVEYRKGVLKMSYMLEKKDEQ